MMIKYTAQNFLVEQPGLTPPHYETKAWDVRETRLAERTVPRGTFRVLDGPFEDTISITSERRKTASNTSRQQWTMSTAQTL